MSMQMTMHPAIRVLTNRCRSAGIETRDGIASWDGLHRSFSNTSGAGKFRYSVHSIQKKKLVN